jgi:hypothetical protein
MFLLFVCIIKHDFCYNTKYDKHYEQDNGLHINHKGSYGLYVSFWGR